VSGFEGFVVLGGGKKNSIPSYTFKMINRLIRKKIGSAGNAACRASRNYD